ncbi:tyrosine-type recombinase/integrase [soil metagenome]
MRAFIGQDLVRKLPLKNEDIRDTKLPGFVVRCRTSGSHTYRVALRRGQWITLGKVTELEPHEARELARVKQSEGRLAKHGLADDPLSKAQPAVTLGTFITETYEPWVVQHRKSGALTVARLRVTFAEFLDTPLTGLSAFAVERWRSQRLKAGVTPSTVNRDLAGLRGALSRAKEWKVLTTHPLADVKAAKVDKTSYVRFLGADEETRLRKALTARDDKRRAERERANAWRVERGYAEWPALGPYTDHVTPLVLVALGTGMRFGELTGLTWADVDLGRALLTVRAESAKSGLGRHLPLNTDVVKVLTTWKPKDARADAYVFPGRDGGRLTDIKSAWKTLLKAAKVTAFRVHDCRHHFASKLAMAGVSLAVIRELLGHASLTMTIRYSHLSPDARAAAVAKLVGA